MSTDRRITIRPVFPTNLFFEKVLTEWKANTTDRKGGFVIKKALTNLKSYPLSLDNYTHLRSIKGIGEDIATRLDSAAQRFREKDGEITLTKVRALKRGEALVYLREATSTKGKKVVPFLSPAVPSTVIHLPTLSQQPSTSSLNLIPITVEPNDAIPSNDLNRSFSQPILPSSTNDELVPQPSTAFSQSVNRPLNNVTVRPKKVALPVSDSLIEFSLSKYPAATVTLIVDGRENRPNGGRVKTMCEHLNKRSVEHELRPLSVGDYLWIVKLGPGAANEMLMDYVVERKTWDDLKHSIRDSRYAEQKQRLQQSGIRNVVLVAEGSDANVDRSLEQALATSSLENGFMIQRTTNVAATARFLADVTNHLQQRLKTETISGRSYAWLQDESRKTKEITVQDCFLRQLTVCPQMSTNKARDVVLRYPSLRSLRQLYRNSVPNIPLDDVLSQSVPSIPQSISRQMGLFFKTTYENCANQLNTIC
ncbi:hypothetical protein M3Y94_00543800 [Aphelenchoides besseyi]|nr:hypothetical protein M3Y94_00543800 [Aphelenchoides besseyi]KAI6225737.1 Crossover junction endonuclease MUS81 [Aphelenchoides besseyi]